MSQNRPYPQVEKSVMLERIRRLHHIPSIACRRSPVRRGEAKVATAMERLKEVGGEAAVEVMTEIQKSAESKIDSQIAAFKDKWDRLFNQRMVYAIVAIAAIVALGIVTSLFTATKDVNQAVIT